MNTATIAGRVVEEPRLKQTHSGFPILEFPIVTTDEYTDKSGEQKTRNIRHNICCYGKTAERHVGIIVKGLFVVVNGAIQNKELDKPEGGKGFRSEIIANKITVPSGSWK